VRAGFRQAAHRAHPDHASGATVAMRDLNLAREWLTANVLVERAP
jgi:hypothetical protein